MRRSRAAERPALAFPRRAWERGVRAERRKAVYR